MAGQADTGACSILPDALGAKSGRTLCLFDNDDGCGDWVVPFGPGFQLQLGNAITASFYLVAGLTLARRSQSHGARCYGIMLCLVSIGSCSFHATSSVTGFFMDIVPMAIAAHMLVSAALHALQLDTGVMTTGMETTRFAVSTSLAAFAVYLPWSLIEAGVSTHVVWGVWAICFGGLCAFFIITCLGLFYEHGILNENALEFFAGIVTVILGTACTAHSFIPGLCVAGGPGLMAQFPFHTVWHLLSSISSLICGRSLDRLLQLTEVMEARIAAAGPAAKQKRKPLYIRMFKDALPSQFSM